MAAIVTFFVPLALTSLLITLTHTIVAAGLARLPAPEISLAAYAVAKSVVFIVENPVFMVRQTIVALVSDVASFRLVSRVMVYLMIALAGILALLAFTPAGEMILARLMGLQGETLDQARLTLRVLFVLPLAAGLRNVFQGVAILAGYNALVPAATVARLLALCGVMLVLVAFPALPGAVAGAVAFVSTLGLEAAVMYWGIRRHHKSPTRAIARRAAARDPLRPPTLTMAAVVQFFLPLALTSLVLTVTQPAIQAGLARTADPDVTLAAWAVAFSLAFVFFSPTTMLHQVPIAFAREDEPAAARRVRTFVALLGIALAGLLLVTAYSAVGPWLLGTLIGAPPSLVGPAVAALKVLGWVPLAKAVREYFWGLLMRRRETGSIGRAKAVNLGVVVGVLLVGVGTGWLPPAMVAAWSLLLGEVVEVALLYRRMARGPVAAPAAGRVPARATHLR